MALRFLLFSAVLWASSLAFAQPVSGGMVVSAPSPAFDRAFRAADRDEVLEVSGADATEVCVVAMLRDQALREVHVPRGVRYTDFDEGLLESARSEILQRMPATERSFELCVATLDSAEAFAGDGATFRQRLADLRELKLALAQSELFVAFPTMRRHIREAELDVSWRAIRARYDVPVEPGEEGWRYTAFITSGVLTGAALLVPLSLIHRALDSSGLRLATLGLSLSSLGGLIVAGVWSEPNAPSTKTRLVYGALWTLASLAGGVALLRADVPRRFRAMGVGLVTGGAIDAVLWAGALRISRQSQRDGATRFSLGRHGGTLEWSASF